MALYGFITRTHGWAKVLTVIGPAGPAAIWQGLSEGADLIPLSGQGAWPRFQEKRNGAIDAFAGEHGIQILDRPAWAEKKAEIAALSAV